MRNSSPCMPGRRTRPPWIPSPRTDWCCPGTVTNGSAARIVAGRQHGRGAPGFRQRRVYRLGGGPNRFALVAGLGQRRSMGVALRFWWCPDRCGPVRRGGIVGRRPAPAEEGPVRLRVHGQFPTLGSSGRPFEPLNEAIETGHVALTSDALKSGAERVERLIIRGPGRLEWRLPGPVDPRSMLEAEWRIGGARSDSVWPSDSVVLATWTERVAAPDSPSGQGMPVRLGPLKGCASGSHSFHLEGHWTVVPSSGDVRVVGLLADPLPDAPFQRTEFVRLYNASDRTVDAGGWHWGGARLTRRRLMAPGETHRFEAGEFVGWPGLANAGGTLQVTTSGGHPVASFRGPLFPFPKSSMDAECLWSRPSARRRLALGGTPVHERAPRSLGTDVSATGPARFTA